MADTSATRALKARLGSDQLTVSDKEKMATARAIWTLRSQGKTLREIAVALNQNVRMIESFVGRDVYAIFCDHFLQNQVQENAVETDALVRDARREFAGFAPDALEYFRTCFSRNDPDMQPEQGVFKDDAKAMWATDKVAKGLGLTEPEHAVRPTITINIGSIKNETTQVAADDAEADAAARAIDITPEPPRA